MEPLPSRAAEVVSDAVVFKVKMAAKKPAEVASSYRRCQACLLQGPEISSLPDTPALLNTSLFFGPAEVTGTNSRFMSQHNSLRAAAGTTGTKRNVLKRFERVAILKSRGHWKEGDRVIGLRKTLPPE